MMIILKKVKKVKRSLSLFCHRSWRGKRREKRRKMQRVTLSSCLRKTGDGALPPAAPGRAGGNALPPLVRPGEGSSTGVTSTGARSCWGRRRRMGRRKRKRRRRRPPGLLFPPAGLTSVRGFASTFPNQSLLSKQVLMRPSDGGKANRRRPPPASEQRGPGGRAGGGAARGRRAGLPGGGTGRRPALIHCNKSVLSGTACSSSPQPQPEPQLEEPQPPRRKGGREEGEKQGERMKMQAEVIREGELEKRSDSLFQLWKKKLVVLTKDSLSLFPDGHKRAKGKELGFGSILKVDCVERTGKYIYFTIVTKDRKEIDFRTSGPSRTSRAARRWSRRRAPRSGGWPGRPEPPARRPARPGTAPEHAAG
ncbi:Pleckstrin-like proteiny-like domain family A member 2 [Aix galericulata]|nr:Pleckstrin-like proteiny-like domain family A member 2 [Aix galericulata]